MWNTFDQQTKRNIIYCPLQWLVCCVNRFGTIDYMQLINNNDNNKNCGMRFYTVHCCLIMVYVISKTCSNISDLFLLWDIAPSSDSVIRTLLILMIKSINTSEESVNLYWTTRYNISEDSHHLTRHRRYLKSHNYSRLSLPHNEPFYVKPNRSTTSWSQQNTNSSSSQRFD